MKVIFISKRTIILFFLVIFLALLAIKSFPKKEAAPVSHIPATPVLNKTIVIDPGHGGADPGALGSKDSREDELNLEISLRLKRIIEKSGGIVVMTRESSEGLYTEESKTLREKKIEDLNNRKKIIETSGCDLFVSIHMNSFTDPRYYGAQTFYMEGSEEGEKLATIIQDQFKDILDNENKREATSREDVYLLREVTVPSVLIEAGFLSNPMEEEMLLSEEYQEKIAWSIYVGILKYFEEK